MDSEDFENRLDSSQTAQQPREGQKDMTPDEVHLIEEQSARMAMQIRQLMENVILSPEYSKQLEKLQQRLQSPALQEQQQAINEACEIFERSSAPIPSPSSPLPSTDEQQEKQKVRTHIRWMIRSDMPEVLAIEAEGFEFPWLEDDFIRCLRQRNCIGMVAEHDDRVAGFMVYELNGNRIQVLNFATAPEMRRRGVGAQMVRRLIGKLSAQRRTRILLEVRETNLSAQLFFHDNGFRAISILRDYYEDTPENAYLMQYLASHATSHVDSEDTMELFEPFFTDHDIPFLPPSTSFEPLKLWTPAQDNHDDNDYESAC